MFYFITNKCYIFYLFENRKQGKRCGVWGVGKKVRVAGYGFKNWVPGKKGHNDIATFRFTT